jgi:hypothetical protein
VLQRRLVYPDHEFLEQVSINRVVTKDGQVFELPERIADWALVKDGEAILGDKKSVGAILSGVKGGIPKNRPTTPDDLKGSFRVTAGRFTGAGNPKSRTKFGDQVLKERYAILRATALGGDVVIAGTDASGTRVERKVPPAGVRISRLNSYGQLPDKLIDQPAAGPPELITGDPAAAAPTAPRGSVMRAGSTVPIVSDTASGEAEGPAPAGGSVVRGSSTRAVPSGTIVSGQIDTDAPPAPMRGGTTTEPEDFAPAAAGGAGATPAQPGLGPGLGGAALDVAGVVLVQYLNRLVEDSYAPIRSQAIREYVRDAVRDAYPQLQETLRQRRYDIDAAQAKGKETYLYVLVEVHFVDSTESDPSTGTTGTTVSNVPHAANVVDQQMLIGGEEPRPYDTSTSAIGDLVRDMGGFRSRYYPMTITIQGTDPKVQHEQKTVATVEAAMGRRVPFEQLIAQSRLGGIDRGTLREYVDHKLKTAIASPLGTPLGRKDDSAQYWTRMRDLIDAPLAEIVRQAKIKGVPLDALKQRAGADSDIGHLIDAPLDDKSAIAWQEHQWTLGGTDTEITQQKAVVDGLRASLDQAQNEKTALLGVDARTDEERAGGEPPHPPWARINKLSTDIAKIREELSSEDRFLKSLQK